MDQQPQQTFSRNALIIASIALVALGIIIILAVIFSSNCNCGGGDGSSSVSFDKPNEDAEVIQEDKVEITQEETNNIAKNQPLATVEDPKSRRHASTDTSDLSTVEDINRSRRKEIQSDRGVDTIGTDVSYTEKTDDTSGETVESDSQVESIKSPTSDRKKRKRNDDETSGIDMDRSSYSSDFSSPTDKSS